MPPVVGDLQQLPPRPAVAAGLPAGHHDLPRHGGHVRRDQGLGEKVSRQRLAGVLVAFQGELQAELRDRASVDFLRCSVAAGLLPCRPDTLQLEGCSGLPALSRCAPLRLHLALPSSILAMASTHSPIGPVPEIPID